MSLKFVHLTIFHHFTDIYLALGGMGLKKRCIKFIGDVYHDSFSQNLLGTNPLPKPIVTYRMLVPLQIWKEIKFYEL